MWITLILMVVSYLVTKSSTGDTKKGLLAAGVVGAGSAYVTSQTEWGSGLNQSFNESFGLDPSWTGFSGDSTGETSGKTPTSGGGTSSTGTSDAGVGAAAGATGIFASMPNWLKSGAAAGAAAWSLSSIPSWVWWLVGGLGVYWLFFKEDY